VGAGDVAVEVRAEVALLEPLDDPAVRSSLVAKVVDSVVVDVTISPVPLHVAYGLATPRTGHAFTRLRVLLTFHTQAPVSENFVRP